MHLLFERQLSGTYPHLLAFSDSSSTIGWLHHSTFNPVDNPMHDMVARYLARLMINEEASLFPEHIAGVMNTIADCLSRDFHLNNNELTNLLHSSIPSQIPKNFQIFTLPENLSSWIESVVGSLPPSQELLPIPSPSNLALSKNGWTTSIGDTSLTPSSTHSPSRNLTCSWSDLQTSLGTISVDLRKKLCSHMELSAQQSQMWFRPSGRTYGLTPQWTHKDVDVSSSNDY